MLSIIRLWFALWTFALISTMNANSMGHTGLLGHLSMGVWRSLQRQLPQDCRFVTQHGSPRRSEGYGQGSSLYLLYLEAHKHAELSVHTFKETFSSKPLPSHSSDTQKTTGNPSQFMNYLTSHRVCNPGFAQLRHLRKLSPKPASI